MNANDTEEYVAAAALARGVKLEPEQLRRIAAVYARNAGIAKLVMDLDLPDSIETAPVFTP
jgi:Protein of unknown function (DUF4089)